MHGKTLLILPIVLGVAFCRSGYAIDEAAKPLQQQWAVAKYKTEPKEREQALEKLAEQARAQAHQHSKDPEVLVWEAIILSTYAGEKGGFGALSLAKEAKGLLEQAEAMNPEVLNGSVYTSLGSLYYKVPGWPIGFGDDDKALSYLQKALAINPQGIDPNYFYGDFMLEEGEYRKAITALEKALSAPPRPDRSLADAGRRQEAETALAKAKAHLRE